MFCTLPTKPNSAKPINCNQVFIESKIIFHSDADDATAGAAAAFVAAFVSTTIFILEATVAAAAPSTAASAASVSE